MPATVSSPDATTSGSHVRRGFYEPVTPGPSPTASEAW
jgi:hypothetical protein